MGVPSRPILHASKLYPYINITARVVRRWLSIQRQLAPILAKPGWASVKSNTISTLLTPLILDNCAISRPFLITHINISSLRLIG